MVFKSCIKILILGVVLHVSNGHSYYYYPTEQLQHDQLVPAFPQYRLIPTTDSRAASRQDVDDYDFDYPPDLSPLYVRAQREEETDEDILNEDASKELDDAIENGGNYEKESKESEEDDADEEDEDDLDLRRRSELSLDWPREVVFFPRHNNVHNSEDYTIDEQQQSDYGLQSHAGWKLFSGWRQSVYG